MYQGRYRKIPCVLRECFNLGANVLDRYDGSFIDITSSLVEIVTLCVTCIYINVLFGFFY